jgi:hypothetical protein
MLGYQLLISKTSRQGASNTQNIVICTLEESEEVLNKHARQGRVYDKVTSTCDWWGSAGNTGKAQQQSSLCQETAELRLIIPVLKPITPAIAFQKVDHHSPAARRAEKEERERERKRTWTQKTTVAQADHRQWDPPKEKVFRHCSRDWRNSEPKPRQ